MRHRSEWFLSDPSTGLVTVKCRPSSMVMPISPASPLDYPGPPSLPSSRPPPLPSSQPPRMGRLSPNVSCDKMMSISGAPSSPLPKRGIDFEIPGLFNMFSSVVFSGQQIISNTPSPAGQSDARLRRRLSDKDKHRLVRRSSSKRNKENGSGETTGDQAGCVSGTPTASEGAEMHDGTPVLKRTTSADSSSSSNNHHHAILSRTRSEDGGQPGGSAVSSAGDSIARSLPRI